MTFIAKILIEGMPLAVNLNWMNFNEYMSEMYIQFMELLNNIPIWNTISITFYTI